MENLTPGQAAATALARLLTDHPELASVIWSVGEIPGVLTGRQTALEGRGEIVDVCAKVMGGHVARTAHYRDDDGYGDAHLITTYQGVEVQVSAGYPLPGADGLTSTELLKRLSERRLGTLVITPGGAS